MVDNDNINKKDLETILAVNKKSIEIGMENAEQNEEIINLLDNSKVALESSNMKILDALTNYNSKISETLTNYNAKIAETLIKHDEKIADSLIRHNEKVEVALIKNNEKIDSVDENVDKKLEIIIKQNEKTNRDIFTVKVLFISTLLNIVMNIVQFFIKK